MRVIAIDGFDSWRQAARQLLAAELSPMRVLWQCGAQAALFDDLPVPPSGDLVPAFKVPTRLVDLARHVSCHDHPERWGLLYTALWRLAHGERELLKRVTDPLVAHLLKLEHDVRHDAYKVKAYVRFRLVAGEEKERYIAWHRTRFAVLPLVGAFFVERFSVMDWAVFTPFDSMHWDGRQLVYGPGMTAADAPAQDALEDTWKAYYRATFNPARIKVKAMLQQMPRRYWSTMPETQIIGEMLREAPARVQAMLKHQEGLVTSAFDVLPADRSIPGLRGAAKTCTACPLHCGTTQTVFGEGPLDARLMLVGEQPGFEEDRNGRPFVGPAGQVLNHALGEAGVDRETLYVTNAVKHFKHWKRHDKAYHRNPDVRDINACKPWLEAEIAAVQPQLVLCLGVTAAKALIGHGFTLKAGYGKWHDVGGRRIRVTYHPAAILRENNEFRRREMYQAFRTDIILAQRELAAVG